MIAEISASSIAFWIPTYVNEYLKFSPEASGIIFSVISLLKSIAPFICLILFRLMCENDVKLIRTMFIVSGAMYAAMVFAKAMGIAGWRGIIIIWLIIMLIGMAITFCFHFSDRIGKINTCTK